jgi:hypothetical protein
VLINYSICLDSLQIFPSAGKIEEEQKKFHGLKMCWIQKQHPYHNCAINSIIYRGKRDLKRVQNVVEKKRRGRRKICKKFKIQFVQLQIF